MPSPPVGAPYDPTGQPFPDLDGSGSVGPLLLQLPGEVYSSDISIQSATGNRGVMGKLIDAAWWLKTNTVTTTLLTNTIALYAKQTASSGDNLIGVLTYAGRFLTLPSGTLRTVLQYIANNAITDAASSGIDPTLSAATISYATARDWHVFTPTAATLTITVNSTAPAPPLGAEINVSAYVVGNAKNVIIEREDASQIVIMTGGASGTNFGSVRLKNIGGAWRLKDATGLGCAWASTVPGSINSP